jgi:hypothetical protein
MYSDQRKFKTAQLLDALWPFVHTSLVVPGTPPVYNWLCAMLTPSCRGMYAFYFIFMYTFFCCCARRLGAPEMPRRRYICECVQFSRIIYAFHARHRALCALARSNAAGTRVQTSEQRKRLETVLGYDGIYRQKLSTDYRAHVAMNIYLYLMNIYSYLRCMNLSGER